MTGAPQSAAFLRDLERRPRSGNTRVCGFRCGSQRLIEKMAVPLRRLRLSVPKHLTDDWQRQSGRGEQAREAVSQIMYSHARRRSSW
jgi:hypothetical protein